MKKYRLLTLITALFIGVAASAQAPVDSSLLGVDILSLIHQNEGPNGTAIVNQSIEIRNALSRHIVANSSAKLQGYRVRIFFDSDRTARAKSASIAAGFREKYPEVPVYVSHVSPYFKVAVGDFRTRADAQRFASKLSATGAYPYVFVVKEQINYPGF